jgi:Transposase DDE domain
LRAAHERSERIAKAQKQLAEREAEREQRKRSNKEKTKAQGPFRTSTSDAEARVMKMPDGGFRPAYNVQVITDPVSGLIVATAIDTTGSDRGLLGKAVDRIKQHYAKLPKVVLADGGFFTTSDIEWTHAQDPAITAYVPLTASKHGTDPYAARKDGWTRCCRPAPAHEE